MGNISRRKFIKNSAMAMMSYSMFGCASYLSAEDLVSERNPLFLGLWGCSRQPEQIMKL